MPKGFLITLSSRPRSWYSIKPSKDPGNKLNIMRNIIEVRKINFKNVIALCILYNTYNESYYILRKMNNLILVRHGQSEWNKEKRFTGWADIDLTKQGQKEAMHAGKLIKELKVEFDAYFTSVQKRAINTLNIILNILNKPNAEINKAWELNERHYGSFTGLNKDEMIKKHGSKQVHVWRRSFNITPPPMDLSNPYHPSKNKIYSNIPINKIPDSESLRNTFERVVPYYEKKIKPLIISKKNILIAAHGNSLRALCKKILNISKRNIINFEIPTGNPLLIIFEKNLEVKKYKYLDSKRAKNILFNV